MNIGERIKQKRIALEMTQTELAHKLGYSNKSAICRIEKGYEKNLTMDRVQLFANALNVPASYLMGWSDEEGNAYTYADDEKQAIISEILAKLNTYDVDRLSALKNFIENT